MVVNLKPWPLTRDCLMYGITVILLIATLNDGRVQWYESLGLVSVYLLYITAMYFNVELANFARRCCCRHKHYKELPAKPERAPLLSADPEQPNGKLEMDEHAENPSLCSVPSGGLGTKIWWLTKLPISSMLSVTIPDCRQEKWRSFYPLTFVMCILWIGTTSYMVAWMITVVGDTLEIPDSVMGLTFLAAGTSVPEAVSSIIVTNQGHGSMGISNSIGSNTFDILLCLGLPWLLKAAFTPTVAGQHWVDINSEGIIYSAISLMSTLLILYVAFALNHFKLDRSIGIVTLLIYLCFLTFVSLVELNVFFVVNLPTCSH